MLSKETDLQTSLLLSSLSAVDSGRAKHSSLTNATVPTQLRIYTVASYTYFYLMWTCLNTNFTSKSLTLSLSLYHNVNKGFYFIYFNYFILKCTFNVYLVYELYLCFYGGMAYILSSHTGNVYFRQTNNEIHYSNCTHALVKIM